MAFRAFKQGRILKKGTKTQSKKNSGQLFLLLYVLILVYLLFFSEGYGRVADAEREFRYNFVPFVEIRRFWVYRKQLGMFALFTNIFGNVLGFMPYGFVLSGDKPKNAKWLFYLLLSGFSISLTVEVIQLITRAGCFDVDDMILNTLGAALGYEFTQSATKLGENINGKKISICIVKKERRDERRYVRRLAAASLVRLLWQLCLHFFLTESSGA